MESFFLVFSFVESTENGLLKNENGLLKNENGLFLTKKI